jgi:formyltetrahydrofolate deformylase
VAGTRLLLIDCPDETGLIYRISGVLYRHGHNIVSNHEFVDRSVGHFFMRTEFTGLAPAAPVLGELRRRLPAGATVRLAPTGTRCIVVMATLEPHCLGDLLLRHASGELPARIAAVISTHEALAPLARRFEIPFHQVSPAYRTREVHEKEIASVLERYRPDYLVLAKYMRLLTPAFVAEYANRIINIHHSFLPAFAGANPYQQAFARGVKIIGATAHLVTAELDAGPIIAQGVLPVDHSYTAEDMTRAGRDIEKIVLALAKAVRLVLEERVFLHGSRTVILE